MQNTEKILSDILKLATTREIQSHYFYNCLAKLVDDQRSKELFLALAEEEIHHRETLDLEILKNGIVVKDTLDALDHDVESRYKEEFDPNMDMKNALLLGISKEKGSYGFYTELALVFAEKQARDLCFELAQQEVRHMVLLELEYYKLLENEAR